jgi:hypothetical protein
MPTPRIPLLLVALFVATALATLVVISEAGFPPALRTGLSMPSIPEVVPMAPEHRGRPRPDEPPRPTESLAYQPPAVDEIPPDPTAQPDFDSGQPSPPGPLGNPPSPLPPEPPPPTPVTPPAPEPEPAPSDAEPVPDPGEDEDSGSGHGNAYGHQGDHEDSGNSNDHGNADDHGQDHGNSNSDDHGQDDED